MGRDNFPAWRENTNVVPLRLCRWIAVASARTMWRRDLPNVTGARRAMTGRQQSNGLATPKRYGRHWRSAANKFRRAGSGPRLPAG